MKTSLNIVLLSSFVWLAACSKSNLPKYYALGGLRMLAVVVDQPEVDSAALPTTVNLSLYVSDLNGSGRNVSFDVAACPDPGVAYGATPNCDSSSARVPITVPTVTPAATAQNSGLFGSPNYTGQITSFAVTVPAAILTGLPTAMQFNGASYIVDINVKAGSESVRTFKRIVVSNKTTKNTNPTLTQILGDGVALTSLPGGDVQLSASASTPESYQSMDLNGNVSTKIEDFIVTWFITDGELKTSRTYVDGSTKWTPATPPSGRNAVVVGVLRDDRGGVAVKIIDL